MWHLALLPIRGPKTAWWPEEPCGCTHCHPAPVIPLSCPSTTTLGVRTPVLEPINPPGTTGTMSMAQARRGWGGKAAWKPLLAWSHLKCSSAPESWELLSLPQNLAKGVMEERCWFGTSGATHQKWAQRDWGVGEPSSGMLKEENTTYIHCRFFRFLVYFSLKSSQNHLENLSIPSHDPQRKQLPQTSPEESANLKRALGKYPITWWFARNSDQSYCFQDTDWNHQYQLHLFFPQVLLLRILQHCNSLHIALLFPIKPQQLISSFTRVFCKLFALNWKANVLLSLPPGWSSGMTDISAAKDFPHHGFPLKIAADDCCLQLVCSLCTHQAVPAELFRLLLLLNIHRRAHLPWNNIVLFQFGLVDISQWNKTD